MFMAFLLAIAADPVFAATFGGLDQRLVAVTPQQRAVFAVRQQNELPVVAGRLEEREPERNRAALHT
jgi:hypothetical protein